MNRAFWSTFITARLSRATFLLAASLAPTACDAPRPDAAIAQALPKEATCADRGDSERLKVLVFKEAANVRADDAGRLARLAETTVARIEGPAVQGRDDALNVAICKARMVIDLPPGSQDAFSGDGRLAADIGYAAQTGADGTRRIHSLSGTEPIAYRLAAMGLKGDPQLAATAPAAAPSPPPEQRQEIRRPKAPPTMRKAVLIHERPEPSWRAREPKLTSRGRPSFDCRSARSRQDRMVCADERLAALDRVAVSLYREALANSDRPTRAALRSTATQSAARRDACRTSTCIAKAYQDRMDQIDYLASDDR